MRIFWKGLCSLGCIFWCTMFYMDYFFGSIIQDGEFLNLRDVELDAVSESTIQFNWTQTIIWCLLSFISSFALCYLTKSIKVRLQGRRARVKEETTNPAPEIVKECEVITLCETNPRFENSKEDINTASTCTLSDVVKNVCTTATKSDTPSGSFEKRCSKLKNEMTELQMASWKEYSNLNKKLDTLTKEKRVLSKQLIQSQKENNNYKKQLSDILNDRSSLLKRLESATKEIRLNTTNKKTTLKKLEEAINCSTHMKDKVLKLTQEKKELEEKVESLQRDSQRFIDKMGLSISDTRKISNNSEIDLKQSERDIEKVQTKLLDLEKSLEKMRYLNAKTNQELDLIVEHVDVVENQALEIQHTRSENTSIEDLKSIEDSQNVLTTVADSKFEISDRVNTCYVEKECDIDADDESKKNKKTPRKGVIVYNYESSTTDTSVSSSETSKCEDTENTEDLDSVSCTTGIISQSPVFQKFLLKTLNTNHNQPLATN